MYVSECVCLLYPSILIFPLVFVLVNYFLLSVFVVVFVVSCLFRKCVQFCFCSCFVSFCCMHLHFVFIAVSNHCEFFQMFFH